MSSDPSSSGKLSGTSTRVHSYRLADNKAISNEFADGLAGVCVGDFCHFIGVEPNLALAAANN
jgi:hypothetical protein